MARFVQKKREVKGDEKDSFEGVSRESDVGDCVGGTGGGNP